MNLLFLCLFLTCADDGGLEVGEEGEDRKNENNIARYIAVREKLEDIMQRTVKKGQEEEKHDEDTAVLSQNPLS